MGFLIITILVLLIYYNPYFDIQEDKILLWYGRGNKRNYKILWKS